MNKILHLKGKPFGQKLKIPGKVIPAMNSRESVTFQKVFELKTKLEQIMEFWENEKSYFKGILISVHYNKIAAKTNRISGLFKGSDSNYSIVGVKFNEDKTHHIITYFLDMQNLIKSISLLEETNKILNLYFDNQINKENFSDETKFVEIPFGQYSISKSKFKQVVADISYIDNFEVESPKPELLKSIITLYKTDKNTKVLLKKIGIDILESKILSDTTVLLNKNELKILLGKAPYLISMAMVDLTELNVGNDDFEVYKDQKNMEIISPINEPTIGVIDTLFDEKVYFNEWVEYHDLVDNNITKSPEDYNHGTAVTSIIVDGPKLNPWLEDGCGRFKVRHFGVAIKKSFSSFTIIKHIRNIIASNKDIKVWNFSLGSNDEINDNFISSEAAELDRIQYENNVIFVISGTNKKGTERMKIGSPADSINSIVVNSVTKNKESANYSREGIVLSFFSKPDVSYYGGSEEKYMKVCEPLGAANVSGTSFAAPWISRKLSYLIDILGFEREIAKALIIDAARGWDPKPSKETISLFGHGIVPIKIEDIIQTKENEIKFFVSGKSEKWNTYNYEFPVPLDDNKYPFKAKAILCYFPSCNKSQGVDYTNTELNIHFGRIDDNDKIKSINDDKQNSDNEDSLNSESNFTLEKDARSNFRKWDNVKYVVETPKEREMSIMSYKNNKNWGIEVKTNNRLDSKDGLGLRFGIVITLREINGINRIDEFIRSCSLRGWIVNEIDVVNKIDIYKKLNETIKFD